MKVGDKVQVKSDGRTGVVKHILHYTNRFMSPVTVVTYISVKLDGGKSITFTEYELEVIK